MPFLAVLAVYSRTLGFALTWDDPQLLEFVRGTYERGGLAALLQAGFAFKYPVMTMSGFYRPLVLFSLWLDSLFTPYATLVFHLTNVLLHGINAILAFYAVSLLYRSRRAALFAGLLFALHPVNAEPVSFVSSRTDLWAATFLLSLLVLRLRWWDAISSRRWVPRFLGGMFFLLAIFSKETAYAFPAVVIFLENILGNSRPATIRDWWLRIRGWLLPLSIPVLLSLTIRLAVVSSRAPLDLTTDPRLLVTRLLWYLRLLTIPWPLNALYPEEALILAPVTLLGAALFVLLVIACLSRRFGGVGTFGAAWVVIFIAPALFGVSTRTPGAIAERYLYLSTFGLACMIGPLLDRAADRYRHLPVWYAVFATMAVSMTAAAAQHSAVWKDNRSLFEDMAAKSPGSVVPHVALGSVYQEEGMLEAAVNEYRKALQIDPDYGPALFDMGTVLEKRGDMADAERFYRQTATAMPTYAIPRFQLGKLYSRRGFLDLAAAEFEETVRLDPNMAEAWHDLGAVSARLGRWSRSVTAYEGAVALRPDDASWRYWLGRSCLSAGNTESARVQQRRLQSLDPALASKLDSEISRQAGFRK